ncbi:MAG TPA: chemotaxis-specific protein-glutamate methyltransferase CheB [Polyangiaceae bacterium]|nr:chemotaxis-specific protein-glutamate methyltransferase CheB [Polyangiaceae bacterium]
MLVVDDSAFARKVVREVLAASPLVEVVGTARDGLEALEKIAELGPDVVTLDLVMPHLDGVGVLRALGAAPAPPRVVVVSASDAESDLGVAALEAGAVDLVRKPTALATGRLYELGGELLAKVQLAAAAAPRRHPPAPARPSPPADAPAPRAAPHGTRLLAIGASTGGPQALTRLFAELPGDLPAPVAAVVHMPVGYTEALARRLDGLSRLTVVEARDGLELRPGLAVIAQAGAHLRVRAHDGGLFASLGLEPSDVPHRPSVDELFASAADALGHAALGVVLTGMGEDGLAGSRRLRERHGRVLVEAESSCVVYGMPRRVGEAGLALAEAPLEAMTAAILRWL